MEVVINAGQSVEIYPGTTTDSAPTVINGNCIIRVESINGSDYRNGAGNADPDQPYLSGPYIKDEQWTVVLVQNDRAIETLYMGQVDNQAGWTNNVFGALQAALDLKEAFPSGGGGGGSFTGPIALTSSSLVVSGSPIASTGTFVVNLHPRYRNNPNFFPLAAANRNVVETDGVVVAASGVCTYTETVAVAAGQFVWLSCAVGATSLTFTPFTAVDGGSTLTLSPGAKKLVYSTDGGGTWITLN